MTTRDSVKKKSPSRYLPESAAFRLIPEKKVGFMQYAIGTRLIEGLDLYHRDQFLFRAVELCGAGTEFMSPEDRRHFAFWAFAAGQTALKQGAFEEALAFYDPAIDILGDTAFQADEELALPLYCGALEAAYALAIDDKIEKYLVAVEAQTQIPAVERARAMGIKISNLQRQGAIPEACACVCRIVKELGVAKVSPKVGMLSAFLELKKNRPFRRGRCPDPARSVTLSPPRLICLTSSSPSA